MSFPLIIFCKERNERPHKLLSLCSMQKSPTQCPSLNYHQSKHSKQENYSFLSLGSKAFENGCMQGITQQLVTPNWFKTQAMTTRYKMYTIICNICHLRERVHDQ